MALGQPKFEGEATSGGRQGQRPEREGAKIIPFPETQQENPREAIHQLAVDAHIRMELLASLDVMLRIAEQESITLEKNITGRILAAQDDVEVLYGIQQELRRTLGEERYYLALEQSEAHKEYLSGQTLKWQNSHGGA